MLIAIRFAHTAAYLLLALSVLYVLYSGLMGDRDLLVWICVSLVLFEGLVLLANRGVCPLRTIAVRYYPDLPEGGDIFFPRWLLFGGFKCVFTALFLIGLILVIR